MHSGWGDMEKWMGGYVWWLLTPVSDEMEEKEIFALALGKR